MSEYLRASSWPVERTPRRSATWAEWEMELRSLQIQVQLFDALVEPVLGDCVMVLVIIFSVCCIVSLTV